MVAKLQTHVAYRCPECGSIVYAFIGKFALTANLIRTKCPCGHSALDITMTNDEKVRLSVPCVFCKQNHNFVVSQSIFFERDLFLLNCPYANMDICFIGAKDKTDEQISRAEEELKKLLTNLEAETIKDIQPIDVDEEELPLDAAVYDNIRFLMKELILDGALDCPCHSGNYDLRFCKGGIQIYCEDCGASHTFSADSVSATEDYLGITSLKLK